MHFFLHTRTFLDQKATLPTSLCSSCEPIYLLIKAFWSSLHLNPQEAVLILKMLDRLDGHKNDRVDFANFVSCARKLKGYATKVEMMTLMYDHSRLLDTVQSEFQELKALIAR
ncbi:unnamed protein product [Durusdinium trenchii]|uniref:EF-hand domain-containing protein n=1 Tax=Durusdinium trenchii TaxID=1381693 RepID=A0ABP0SGP6_9DINO